MLTSSAGTPADSNVWPGCLARPRHVSMNIRITNSTVERSESFKVSSRCASSPCMARRIAMRQSKVSCETGSSDPSASPLVCMPGVGSAFAAAATAAASASVTRTRTSSKPSIARWRRLSPCVTTAWRSANECIV
eukprot:6205679-Pleurochrysis_carterae.AAC.2